MSQLVSPVPEVGMGATVVYYSDRQAFTITRVSPSAKTFWMSRDKVVRLDQNGMSDSQKYAYVTDPDGGNYAVTLRKDGKYRVMGGMAKVKVDVRSEYYDYSF